jgi:Flp pilus assembly CpaE family ATPase
LALVARRRRVHLQTATLDSMERPHLQLGNRDAPEGLKLPVGQEFNSYAISNLRGGVGKSSIAFHLAFNLAYEMSRKDPLHRPVVSQSKISSASRFRREPLADLR